MFDENSLVTVWSAPNYCYRCGNAASIMQVDGEGKVQFRVYDAADENLRDVKNPAMRRAVSFRLMRRRMLMMVGGTFIFHVTIACDCCIGL